MKRYFPLVIFALISGCSSPDPQITPQLLNVYITSAAYPLVGELYNCAPTSVAINLSDPHSADVTIRLGSSDNLATPAFQFSTEDILVIANPQTGVTFLSLDQVRSIFLGQIMDWKEVGGNDLAVQVWSLSPDEDVQSIFNRDVMNGQPISSLARLAVSGESMVEAIGSNSGSVGILPRRLINKTVQSVFNVESVPVLIITKDTPAGSLNELISCLQQENH